MISAKRKMKEGYEIKRRWRSFLVVQQWSLCFQWRAAGSWNLWALDPSRTHLSGPGIQEKSHKQRGQKVKRGRE